MSESTQKRFEEQLHTNTHVEEKTTNKENYSNDAPVYAKVEGTPFHVIGEKEKGYILVSGTYQLTEYLETPEKAIEYLETHTWEIVITLITMVIHMTKKIENYELNKKMDPGHTDLG